METITMMQLRKEPGEYAHRVYKHGESFLVTNQGRPMFCMVPVSEARATLVIKPDGSGPKPLTFKQNLGGEYGAWLS
jgi:antitoxin (DNA-binding transcriptional repressor) of toxin-antitoxin stability system